ncbi:MAG TPA: choice-of-anchor tandem repeat GloVer-containing protein, partial [Candidatus Binatia bacterium]|nr:choice-of-anchor tandem repeat GloVer-containing protein [Candidatus Binatia bacterium]
AITTLHAFSFGADGAVPLAGLAQGPDGNFFGTTYQGARGYGTVFRITAAGVLTTLHAFFPPDGDGGHPFGRLAAGSDGAWYGPTESGGAADLGTLFRVTPAGAFATLHSFGGSDGAHPQAGLTAGAAGTLYGTTAGGGAAGNGVLFQARLPHAGR